MQLNVALLNAEISYARRRLDICKLFTLSTGQNGRQKQLKRVGKHCCQNVADSKISGYVWTGPQMANNVILRKLNAYAVIELLTEPQSW